MDKYYSAVLEILTKEGELGVSVIAKKIGVPTSSLHKYLERQDYFKKTARAKWDIPERVTEEFNQKADATRLSLLAQAFETQTLLVATQLDNLQSAVQALVSQSSGIRPLLEGYRPPVADPDPKVKIDSRLYQVMEAQEKVSNLIKKQKANIPEEYREILNNFDMVRLVLREGTVYTEELIQGEIYSLLVGKTTELSEEVIGVLKDNQIGQN